MTSSDIGRQLRSSLWPIPLAAVPPLLAPLINISLETSDLLSWVTVILWCVLLLLSALFGNSRLFFTSLLTALTWLSYQPRVTETFLGAPALPVILLLPLFLPAVHVLSGRGVVTQASLPSWIIALLFSFFYLLWAQGPPSFAARAETLFLERRELLSSVYLSISELLYIVGGVLLIIRSLIADRVTEGAATAFLLVCYFAHMEGLPVDTQVAWTLAPVLAAGSLLFETYSLAYLDALTRLPGRRAMESYSRQLGKQYAVAMIDIDHFKHFNDTHGHHVGDQVLKMVAARLRLVGAGGKVFRYGGEEFTVFFRHDDQESILKELERLRLEVGDKPFILRGSSRPPDRKGKRQRGWGANRQKAKVTVSIGVAFPAPPGRKVEDVRKRADKALYEAKKKGRNRVEVA